MFLLNIRMINLSLNELKLIAQIRNISDYENKSKEDLIKALSEPKPETTPKQRLKPETPKTTPETKSKTTSKQILKTETSKQTLKPETPKTTPKTKPKTLKPETTLKQTVKPETKLVVKFNRKKFKKLRKDFDELKHKFFNKYEIIE